MGNMRIDGRRCRRLGFFLLGAMSSIFFSLSGSRLHRFEIYPVEDAFHHGRNQKVVLNKHAERQSSSNVGYRDSEQIKTFKEDENENGSLSVNVTKTLEGQLPTPQNKTSEVLSSARKDDDKEKGGAETNSTTSSLSAPVHKNWEVSSEEIDDDKREKGEVSTNATNTSMSISATDLNITTHPRTYNSTDKESLPSEEEFSACLLIRDENHQLIEWLAYHYLYLPLRHLVIAVDDTSLTSPKDIINRWKGRMDIVQWSDKDFYDGPALEGTPLLEQRQRRFYMHCGKYHKERNRTWVMMTDVDEYVAYNHLAPDDPKFSRAVHKMKKAKATMPRTWKKYSYARDTSPKTLQSNHTDLWQDRVEKMEARNETLKNHSLGNADNTIINLMNTAPWKNEVCMVIPRILMISKPTIHKETRRQRREREELGIQKIEYEFDKDKLRTLIYFYHDGKEPNWWGKVFIDVSRTSYEHLSIVPETVHSPFIPCGWPVPKYEESPLRIHHYLGSWKEYIYKRDCRRTREVFDRRGKKRGFAKNMEPWLDVFVDRVGLAEANFLLKDVGVLQPLPINGTEGCITTEMGTTE